MKKLSVEVVEITKTMVYGLVLSAVALSVSPAAAQAEVLADSAPASQTEMIETIDGSEIELVQVAFYDQRGNTVDVTINPQSGDVVSVEEVLG